MYYIVYFILSPIGDRPLLGIEYHYRSWMAPIKSCILNVVIVGDRDVHKFNRRMSEYPIQEVNL